MSEKNKFHQIAEDIANLVTEKNKAYGDSFSKSKEIIKVLYPNGIQPEQFQDALVMIRVIDKLFRIATMKEAFGEDPWNDILGYALLAVNRNKQEKKE